MSAARLKTLLETLTNKTLTAAQIAKVVDAFLYLNPDAATMTNNEKGAFVLREVLSSVRQRVSEHERRIVLAAADTSASDLEPNP